MNPNTDATLVYQHPDGFTLAFNDDALIAINDEGKIVSLPIGPLGLVELADKLRAIGSAPENMAEQAGRELGIDALNECLTADDEYERFDILREALLRLAELPHHDRAAGGFAAALVDVIERGLGVST